MSKECKGKYHGNGIKYIDDDQKYCLACQQEYARRKKEKKEVWAGIGGAVLALVAIINTIGKFLGGGKGDGNNQS